MSIAGWMGSSMNTESFEQVWEGVQWEGWVGFAA